MSWYEKNEISKEHSRWAREQLKNRYGHGRTKGSSSSLLSTTSSLKNLGSLVVLLLILLVVGIGHFFGSEGARGEASRHSGTSNELIQYCINYHCPGTNGSFVRTINSKR